MPAKGETVPSELADSLAAAIIDQLVGRNLLISGFNITAQIVCAPVLQGPNGNPIALCSIPSEPSIPSSEGLTWVGVRLRLELLFF